MGVEYAGITVLGTVGRDAELRFTPDGTSNVSFSLASNKTSKGEKRVRWFKVTWWGKTAEALAESITKGKLVFVQGQFDVRDYTDNSGKERYSLEIRAESVQLLSTRQDAENGGGETRAASGAPRSARPQQRPQVDESFDYGDDSDVPF